MSPRVRRRRPRTAPALPTALALATLAACAPGAAGAAEPTGATGGPAFGAPRAVSPRGGSVDSPQAAVAPGGRTTVLWRRTGERSRDFAYVAAIGERAGALGRAAVVRAGVRSARTVGGAQLLARPDGGFVACFGDNPRRGSAVVGCSIARPDGGFGPLRVVERVRWQGRPTIDAAVRSDGRTVVVSTHRVGGGRQAVRSTVLSPAGRRLGVQDLGTVRGIDRPSVAAGGDGTVAVGWSTGRVEGGGRVPTLRVMPPAATAFGAPVALAPEPTIGGNVVVHGGPALLVSYEPEASSGTPVQTRVAQLVPGTGAVLRGALPVEDDSVVTQLLDGTPFGVVGRQVGAETDCSDVVSGRVDAGPLATPGTDWATAQRLSAPRQIALEPQAATMADGTVVATWRDAAGGDGRARIEAAVRPPGGPFAPARALPLLSVRDVALAAGGDQAVLAWVVGSAPFGPSHLVVSALRREPPYAAPAPLPRHPRASCS